MFQNYNLQQPIYGVPNQQPPMNSYQHNGFMIPYNNIDTYQSNGFAMPYNTNDNQYTYHQPQNFTQDMIHDTNECSNVINTRSLPEYAKMIVPRRLNNNEKSIINFIIEYFDFTFDDDSFLCEYASDDPYDERIVRLIINKKRVSILPEVAEDNRSVILFDPFRNNMIAKMILEKFITKNNIENILIMYIVNNQLYIKSSDGEIMYKSRQFEFNANLGYLDIFFRLIGIDIDLKEWDNEIQ